jgi:hypothetical protein
MRWTRAKVGHEGSAQTETHALTHTHAHNSDTAATTGLPDAGGSPDLTIVAATCSRSCDRQDAVVHDK